MKKLILGLILLLSSPAALADTLRCTGHYVIYSVEAVTKIKGVSVAAPIQINVTGPFGMKHNIKMSSSHADIAPGHHIHIEAVGPEGKGALSVEAVNTQNYRGSFQANTPMGSGSIEVNCTLTPASWRQFFGM